MSMISADFAIEGNCSNKDAKSALRDALRAKLKTSSSSCFGMENQQGEVNGSPHVVPVSNIDNDIGLESVIDDDSDSNEDSDGKGDDKDSISNIPIEERRLRNRLAARKCREKRKQRILNLEKICSNLEGRISTLQSEIEGLDEQKQNLSKALENHTCVRFAPKPTAVITNNVLRK